MKKCPYCGKENDENREVCERCRAAFPHEEPEKTEEPVRVSRRKNKE